LEESGVRVSTVEHLLAVLWCLGLDNVQVLLDGEEVPILDGSAAPFVDLVREGGLRRQDSSRVVRQVVRSMAVRDGARHISIEPARSLSVDCTLDFAHSLISDQRHRYIHHPEAFAMEIAPARTFGFLKDVGKLRQAGLARGGSLQNAVVVDRFSVLNPDGLRFPDEFARHKVLDILGDLALLGGGLQGRVVAVRSGHRLHRQLVRAMLAQPECWRILKQPADRAESEPQADLALGVEGLQGA
jgi:UDP-3-O-[3-hydroxymyristoyl] N-acetylglucosamine deacetylase